DGAPAYLLWAAAFVLEWVTPMVTPTGGVRIAPAPFVEGHGPGVIVALGESVVAIGIGAAHLPVDLALASVAVLGLLLAACLWWAYFGGDDPRAQTAPAPRPPPPPGPPRRGRRPGLRLLPPAHAARHHRPGRRPQGRHRPRLRAPGPGPRPAAVGRRRPLPGRRRPVPPHPPPRPWPRPRPPRRPRPRHHP